MRTEEGGGDATSPFPFPRAKADVLAATSAIRPPAFSYLPAHAHILLQGFPYLLTLCFANTQVKANGLIVFVPKFGIEGPVYLTPPPSSSTSKAGGATKKKGTLAVAEEEELFVLDEEAQAVTSR